MKVICAGLPKTGTKSIAAALRILGYDKVFDVEEAIEFAFCEWEAVWEARTTNLDRVLDLYGKNVEAVVDLPHSYFFHEFLRRWPQAKVILMTRDPDAWFKSYKAMMTRAKADYMMLFLFYFFSPSLRRLAKWYYQLSIMTLGSTIPHEFLWKTFMKRHNAAVRAIVPPEQLLEYHVQEGWEPLCKFLGREVPDVDFPIENQASDPTNVADRMMHEPWIAKKMRREIKLVCACFFVAVFAVLACVVL